MNPRTKHIEILHDYSHLAATLKQAHSSYYLTKDMFEEEIAKSVAKCKTSTFSSHNHTLDCSRWSGHVTETKRLERDKIILLKAVECGLCRMKRLRSISVRLVFSYVETKGTWYKDSEWKKIGTADTFRESTPCAVQNFVASFCFLYIIFQTKKNEIFLETRPWFAHV